MASDDETLIFRTGTILPSMSATAHPSQTIRPEAPEATPTLDTAVEALRASAGHREGAVSVEGVLGVGGMGVVHLARQTVVGRHVAVKSIRPEVASRKARRRLLEEAWVTGALEHPNIVPVYTITIDDGGEPHIVLKRIEGVGWEVLIADREAVVERFGAADLLAWNVGILRRVCDAMHFAHSKGMLHRDLKPENVMIGEFGEVYVLDWGLAVGLRRDPDGRIPWAGGETRAAGTPRYMAPEMAAGEGSRLSPQSDIYLLGGILYRLLTGHAPHSGETIEETLAGIHTFTPTFPPDVPHALARLCQTALHPDPAQRPASAREFERTLATWLEKRSADALAAQARFQLRALEEALEEGADRQTIYRQFGACRFGFQQALRAWPGNDDARRGLRTAILHVARYELTQEDPRAVEGLLAEVDQPPATMLEAVEVMKRTQAEARKKMERLQADLDPRLGQRTRIFIIVVVGISWTLTPLLTQRFAPPINHPGLIGFNLLMLAALIALMLWARESMSRTAINRRVGIGMLLVPLGTIMFSVWGVLTGTSAATSLALSLSLYACLTAMAAITVDVLLTVAVLGYVAAFFVAGVRPDLLYPAIAAANLWLTVTAVVTTLIRIRQQPGNSIAHLLRRPTP